LLSVSPSFFQILAPPTIMSDDKKQPAVQFADNDNGGADHSNALVIRDGFPAVLDPSTQKWWIEETDATMKLPRHAFWSHDEALQYDQDSMATLIDDCHLVFTARTRDDNASYSAGTTYFLPALMKPRCALEGLVQTIFQRHVQGLPEGMYKPDQSGAEWWTLVLGEDNQQEKEKEKQQSTKTKKKNKPDEEHEEEEEEEEDDVGWHYDADYGLEDQAPGLLLHPRVGTVTYLSNTGAPTVITDCLTPKQGKVQTLDGLSISKAYVSYPKIGKHTSFDGRLLHGAPSDIFPSLEALSKAKNGPEEPPSKRLKTEPEQESDKPQPRITLLVNIWLNHCPMDAELLDDEVVEQMKTSWDTTEKAKKLFQWNDQADLTQPTTMATTRINYSTPLKATKKKNDDDDDDTLEDEIVLCNHKVRVQYGATLEEYHAIAEATMGDNGTSSLQVELGKGVMSLHVGDPVSESEEEEEAEEE
jgi:hypothetical protein